MEGMLPLRTIQLGPYPLRVYASPLDVPDHPWASYDDLMTLAEMNQGHQALYLNKLRREVPAMLHELPDGTVLVAEPLVSRLFQVWITNGCMLARSLLDHWTLTWVELFAARNAHLPRDQWQRVIREAGLRNALNVPGMTVMQ